MYFIYNFIKKYKKYLFFIGIGILGFFLFIKIKMTFFHNSPDTIKETIESIVDENTTIVEHIEKEIDAEIKAIEEKKQTISQQKELITDTYDESVQRRIEHAESLGFSERK